MLHIIIADIFFNYVFLIILKENTIKKESKERDFDYLHNDLSFALYKGKYWIYLYI